MTDGRRWWALAVLCTSSLVIGIDSLVLNVALPTLVRSLHASTSELQWIVDSYLLAIAGLILVAGSLGDRFGRARILRIGLIIFGAASAVAAWSDSAAALIACRAVMGVGAAMIMPNTLSVLTNLFTDSRERARAIGMWSAITGLGLSLGPMIGGLLLSRFWWGSVFLVNVPIVVVAVAVGWWLVPDSRDPARSRFDPLGVVLSIAGASTLVWATIQAPSHGWGSLPTLASFAGALALVTALIVWELRCAHPMLDLRFFRDPRFSAANLASVTANFGFAGSLFILTQLLQFVNGDSPAAAGVRLTPMAVTFITASLASPRVTDHIGTKRAVVIGLGVFAAGLLVLTTVSEGSGYWTIAIGMAGIGGGYGFVMTPTTEAIMGAVPREKAGLGAGTNNTTRQMGNAFGVGVFGSLLVSGYRSVLATKTAGLTLSRRTISLARDSLGGALSEAQRLGGGVGRSLAAAARAGFIHGMHLGLLAGAALLLVGAALSLVYLPARGREPIDVRRLEDELLAIELAMD